MFDGQVRSSSHPVGLGSSPMVLPLLPVWVGFPRFQPVNTHRGFVYQVRSESKPTKAMLHAYDGTRSDRINYHRIIQQSTLSQPSITLWMDTPCTRWRPIMGPPFCWMWTWELVVDGILYNFNYCQTTFIDSQHLDNYCRRRHLRFLVRPRRRRVGFYRPDWVCLR